MNTDHPANSLVTQRQASRFPIYMALALLVAEPAGHAAELASYDRATDQHGFTVFLKEGGWCWYQDPRAIITDGELFLGSVRGNGDGEALVGVHDLKNLKPLGTVVLHPTFDRDDHNAPAFHVRKDGAVLAIYSRHHRDLFHFARTSSHDDPLQWGEEVKHTHEFENGNDRVTYMNLCYLEDEQRLYNFFRGIDFNPTFVTSADDGDTWGQPVHFFKNEETGRHRPYARYATNGQDTIYVSITDAHPRVFGNSLYYFEFRAGQFHRADGTTIKSLAQDGPLKPSESELIYKGSMTTEKPEGYESVPGSAWTSSIAVDRQGHPHIAYTLYLSNNDHRYRVATWDGSKWIDREVAYGGKCLYPQESSYTGLITLDPVDPSLVVISTDVAPSTGVDEGGQHEIYRAHIGLEDSLETINWDAVTSGSAVRNIRPVIVRDGTNRVILWNRGVFKTYTNYQLDTVGVIEQAGE